MAKRKDEKGKLTKAGKLDKRVTERSKDQRERTRKGKLTGAGKHLKEVKGRNKRKTR